MDTAPHFAGVEGTRQTASGGVVEEVAADEEEARHRPGAEDIGQGEPHEVVDAARVKSGEVHVVARQGRVARGVHQHDQQDEREAQPRDGVRHRLCPVICPVGRRTGGWYLTEGCTGLWARGVVLCPGRRSRSGGFVVVDRAGRTGCCLRHQSCLWCPAALVSGAVCLFLCDGAGEMDHGGKGERVQSYDTFAILHPLLPALWRQEGE